MEKGQLDWKWHLKRMKGHPSHGAGTGDTGGGETEVGAASQLLPWAQAVPVEPSLSRDLDT